MGRTVAERISRDGYRIAIADRPSAVLEPVAGDRFGSVDLITSVLFPPLAQATATSTHPAHCFGWASFARVTNLADARNDTQTERYMFQ